jgi:hypothetical protein
MSWLDRCSTPEFCNILFQCKISVSWFRHKSLEEESPVHSVVEEVGAAHFSPQVLSSPGKAIPAMLQMDKKRKCWKSRDF